MVTIEQVEKLWVSLLYVTNTENISILVSPKDYAEIRTGALKYPVPDDYLSRFNIRAVSGVAEGTVQFHVRVPVVSNK